tara:strand:- start:29849 stop:30586 length:738 start_codon:yes stop_codon:yes gene_type:complete
MDPSNLSLEPAVVIHTRAYKESSLIVELFTKNKGRVTTIAKGVKRPKNRLRSILTPTSIFSLSTSGRGEMKNIISCEVVEAFLFNSKETLSSIFYINELIYKFFEKEDPHKEIFYQYSLLLRSLSRESDLKNLEYFLRIFELKILNEVGYGINLTTEANSDQRIVPNKFYSFNPEEGFKEFAFNKNQDNDLIFPGQDIIDLGEGNLDNLSTRKSSKIITRKSIDLHLGSRKINIRKFFKQQKINK